jgi:opacity protein-like surface antigen
MKIRNCILLLVALGVPESLTYAEEAAAKHEVGLTLGGLLNQTRTNGSTKLDLSPGVALQANYGYRLLERQKFALYGEVHFLANPQRTVSSSDQTLTRDVATIFVTPGIRVKFLPRKAISPYLAIGGGYAAFEQSVTRLDGKPNGASRELSRGAFDFGGGVDVKFWRFVGLRAEIRDVFTGSPAYNTNLVAGGQHNVVAGGGFVLRFR